MFHRSFAHVFFASLLILPFALTANPGDKNPEDAPPCAPKKPAAARACARKVVRVDAGPWDAPTFIWHGRSPEINSWPTLTLTETTGTHDFIIPRSFKIEYSHDRSPARYTPCEQTGSWQGIPIEGMYNAKHIVYHAAPTTVSPWRMDPAFFSYFPRLCSLTLETSYANAAMLPAPSAEDFNPQKLIYLDMCIHAQDTESLATLRHLENMRALFLNMEEAGDVSSAILETTASFEKLQALALSHLSNAHGAALRQVIQSCPNLKEICLSVLGDGDADTAVFDALRDHPFTSIHLQEVSVKSLRALDVSRLARLDLDRCGAIEQGFKEAPSQLKIICFRDTWLNDEALETLPFESVEHLVLTKPNTIQMLARAACLKPLCLQRALPEHMDAFTGMNNEAYRSWLENSRY